MRPCCYIDGHPVVTFGVNLTDRTIVAISSRPCAIGVVLMMPWTINLIDNVVMTLLMMADNDDVQLLRSGV